MVESTLKTVHAIELAGLKANAPYYYRLRQVMGPLEFSTDIYDFETDFNYTVTPVPASATLGTAIQPRLSSPTRPRRLSITRV